MDLDREALLIRTFVVRQKHQRYIDAVHNPKTRHKLLRELYHFGDLDPRWAIPIKGRMSSAEGVLEELRRLGAGVECYVISNHPDLDGTVESLSETLRAATGWDHGLLVCCVPGLLGYYEGEGPDNQFILHRAGAPGG